MHTLEFQIIGEVGIIGGLDIVIIVNNRGVGLIWGVGRGGKNSLGGFLVLICQTKHNAFFFFFNKQAHILIQFNARKLRNGGI